MKKIMISAIILLPIMVLLVLVVTMSIVGNTAHIYVDRLSFGDDETIELRLDETVDLNVKVLPLNATNKQIIYESLDERVAVVGENGTVKAVYFGETYIRVKSAENESLKIQKKIRVTGDSVDKLEFIQNTDNVYVGENFQLTVKVIPVQALNKSIKWESSDESIITVNEMGVVSALKSGTVTITASSESDPSKTVSTEIESKPRVKEIYIDNLSPEIINISETRFPTVKFIPSEADEPILFSSSDENIAKIDADGKINFIKCGEAELTASVDDGMGNIYSVKKTFIYTADYLTDLKFDSAVYEFDYDEYSEKSLPIKLVALPTGVQKAANITFSAEGYLNFDGNDFTVEKPTPFEIEVTATAETYDGKTIKASCFVTVFRDVFTVETDFSKVETSGNKVIVKDKTFDLSEVLTVTPDNHTASVKYESDNDEIASVGANGLVTFAKSGSVTITATYENRKGGAITKEITLEYDGQSDETIFADSIEYSFENNFVTSRKSYEFTVTVSPSTALDGNRYEFSENSATVVEKSESGGNAVLSCSVAFEGRGKKQLSFVIYSGDKPVQSADIVIESTFGTIGEAGVFRDGYRLDDGSEITFNVGETLSLEIEGGTPDDFDLSADSISIKAYDGDFDAACLFETPVIEKADKNATIKIKAKNATYNGAITLEIIIGGVTRSFKVNVNAPAQAIGLFCGNKTLDTANDYVSLSETVELCAKLFRKDGAAVTNRKVLWRYGDKSGTFLSGETFEIEPIVGYNELIISSEDGNVSETYRIEKTDLLKDFGIQVRYIYNGELVLATEIDSVKTESSANITFPMWMQGKIALGILLPRTLIGGISEETMQSKFRLSEFSSVGYIYSAEASEIIIDFKDSSFDREIVLSQGEIEFSLNVKKSDIKNIDMIGYDMNNESDIYKGLQQVRVFAKHSYYDGKEVDYFKVPLKVEGSLEFLGFKLTGVKGNDSSVITAQSGRNVSYNGKAYYIEEDGSLSDSEGNKAVTEGKNETGITWVDPFTEKGYARIYFGAFKGLTEQEIKSDGFGDFDETGLYNLSDGAYLQVEANDGTPTLATYFNFNVVEDIAADETEPRHIVNIVDAEGFKANKCVVLHENIYGPEEIGDAEPSAILDSSLSEEVDTELIYGNGHSVNYRAKSMAIKAEGLERDTVTFGRAYNVTLKGTTPNTENNSEYLIQFSGTVQYYCDVQACQKGLYITGEESFVKNTIYRYIQESAIQILDEAKCTVENVVIVDALKGLETKYDEMDESKGFFIRGFLDVINYRNDDEPILSKNPAILAVKGIVLDQLKKSGIELIERPRPTDPKNPHIWANIIMSNSGSEGDELYAYDRKFHYGEDEKTNIVVPFSTGNPGNSYVKDYFDGIYTWNLQRGNNVFLAKFDIGVYTYKERKDITIDCQLKENDEPNTVHLAWHMNRAYRNTSLAGWNSEDHDKNLQYSKSL